MPRVEIVSPADSGPLSLAVVEFGEGSCDSILANGFDPSAGPVQVVTFGGSVWQHRARVVSVLAGPLPTGRWRVQRISPAWHARPSPARSLAILEQTDTSGVQVRWDVAIDGDRACIPASVASRFRLVVEDQPSDERGETCLSL